MRWRVFGLSITLLAWSSPVFAYIPPSEYILKTWVKKHSGPKSIRIKSQVTAYQDGKPTDIKFKETTVFQADHQTIKSWVSDEHERRLFYTEKKLSSSGPLARLLFSSDLGEVISTLRTVEIPIRTEAELLALKTEAERRRIENESLLRWNGVFAWVIGVSPSIEPKLSQIWFEKDTFLPIRLVYRILGRVDEFRMEGYRFTREYPFPKVLHWVLAETEGSQVVRQDIKLSSELIEVAVEPDKVAPPSSTIGFTELGNSASSALKENIQKYYDSFR